MRKTTVSPSPKYRRGALLSALTLASLLALPAGAETLEDALRHCTEFSDDRKRLACFDKAAGKLHQIAEQRFGHEERDAVQEAPESISATITDAVESAHGKYTFTLDNGQVWRQTDSGRAIWRGGEQVTLERGALGSFFMRKTTGGRSLRVKRIK